MLKNKACQTSKTEESQKQTIRDEIDPFTACSFGFITGHIKHRTETKSLKE